MMAAQHFGALPHLDSAWWILVLLIVGSAPVLILNLGFRLLRREQPESISAVRTGLVNYLFLPCAAVALLLLFYQYFRIGNFFLISISKH